MKKPIFRFNKKSMIHREAGYRSWKYVICFYLASMIFFTALNAFALPFESELSRGNDLYKKGDYSQAGQVYGNILEKKRNDRKAGFNLGDAFYKEGRYKESEAVFKSLTDKSVAEDLRQKAFYNLGNSFFKQEDYKNAIDAYEESLKIDAKDKDAQFNLDLARKMLAMPRQDKEKQKKDEQQKKKDQSQDKNQNKNNDRDKNKNKDNKDEKQLKPGQMSKEDALRILNALEDKEKHKDQKLKAGRGGGDVKDW
ncbi:MAG: tetratricopeptide repeat protein [Smithella sp.]